MLSILRKIVNGVLRYIDLLVLICVEYFCFYCFKFVLQYKF